MLCLDKLVLLLCFINCLQVQCAMKKSWKSTANFDTDIPKFTPFKVENTLNENNGVKLTKVDFANEIIEAEALAAPMPTVNTLVESESAPYRSKIKANSKYVADIYSKYQQDMNKNTNDFGKFTAQEVVAKPTKVIADVPAKQEESQDVINEVLEELSEAENIIESDHEKDLINNITDDSNSTIKEYNIGPLMNLTIDSADNLVKLNFDKHTLKDIITGRGGGKKYGMLERVVPLFVLPFLIQSAVVPFMVTIIKLFLVKSVFAGKIAILLLLLGAFKNHQNNMYMKSPHFPQVYPERRYENNFNDNFKSEPGYKAEGTKTFIN